MKISRNSFLGLASLSLSCLVPTAEAVDGLLAAQPGKFRPVTVAAGQPQFHIPPTSRLARNEHPRFLLVPEDLDTLCQRLVDPRLAAEFQALKRQAEDSRETDTSGWEQALLWKLTGNVVRRGGQSVPQAPDWWARWGYAKPQREFMEGRITAYRTHPLYDYACGDARFSYPPRMGCRGNHAPVRIPQAGPVCDL